MAWITVPPTKSDRRVAKALARHTSGGTERAAQALTLQLLFGFEVRALSDRLVSSTPE
jgi:hypothetical protein